MAVSAKRSLTKLLRAVGDEHLPDGATRSETMAKLIWELACTGSVAFPDGRELKASVKDWKDAVQWIYTHCDGAARVEQAIALGLEGTLSETPLAELQRIVGSTMTLLSADTATQVDADEEDA